MAESPTYNGSDGGRIDLATARQRAQNHRTANPADLLSHYFGREILDQILQQRGCTGIRVYHAINDKQEKQLMVVGVDNKGSNMLPASSSLAPGDMSIMDNSWPCPPICPPNDL